MQEFLRQSLNRKKEDLAHRQKIVKKWAEIIPRIFPEAQIIVPHNFFRVILTGVNRVEIKKRAKILGFDLNEWDGDPISPAGVNLAKFGYQKGVCPNAERFMQSYITLPTNIRVSVADVERFRREF